MMKLHLESMEAQLDYLERVAEEHRGDPVDVCAACYVPREAHEDMRHLASYWPIEHLIVHLRHQVDIERSPLGGYSYLP